MRHLAGWQHFVLATATSLVLLTGCAEKREPSVATAADQAPAAQGSGQPSQSAAPKPERLTEQEKGIKYARCMTEHGVEVSDPVDGAMPYIKQNDGMVIIGGLTDTLPAGPLRTAWMACRHYYPSTTYRKVDPAEAQEYRSYAACMQELGVAEGLSVIESDGTIATKNDAATRVGEDQGPSPEFMTAHYKCRKHLSGGQGDPPPLDR